jgi:tripartite-type tricarboxylate transporter receptor subunit TctC
MGLLVIPHLHPQGGFDALNDLAPVASVATVPMVLAVSNASGFTDLKSMIEFMRQNPGKVNLGSGGPGTTAHLSQALFLKLAGAQGELVQYRGTGPALIDVIAGTIQGIIDQTVTLMPLHADKRARAIAVSAPQRVARMPDVPTFAEAGLPQFDLRIWNGLVAPKGTPRATLDRIAAAVSQVMDSPEYVERVEKQFASEIPSMADRGPDGFRRLMERDATRVADLVKSIGLQGK